MGREFVVKFQVVAKNDRKTAQNIAKENESSNLG